MRKKSAKKDFLKKGKSKECCESNSGQAIYGLGFIGAAAYYILNATSFWIGFLGILKAIIWPVFLVYEIFKYLGV